MTPPPAEKPPDKPPPSYRIKEPIRPAIPEPARNLVVDHPRGVVVRAQNGADFYFFADPKAESFWTPGALDVKALEQKLPAFLKAQRGVRKDFVQRFADYTRQYVGIVTKGQRWIWVNFFCGNLDSDWQHGPVLAKDGGECYGRFLFLPSSGRFTGFSVNGSG